MAGWRCAPRPPYEHPEPNHLQAVENVGAPVFNAVLPTQVVFSGLLADPSLQQALTQPLFEPAGRP